MFPAAAFGFGSWWIFPLVMIGVMVICFFMMGGHMGSMICRPGFHRQGRHGKEAPDPALDILKKRYARGEIDKKEYEEKKKVIERHD